MDLRLFARVLWRFRLVVVPGFIAAAALAFLAMARIDSHTLTVSYRKPQQYVSYETLFVTKPGFPWGRLNTSTDEQAHFTSLAIIYSNLVTTDPVRSLMRRQGRIDGTVEAAPVLIQSTGEALPLIRIAGIAHSRGDAIRLTRRASVALREWISRQQGDARTPTSERVVVQVVSRAQAAKLFAGRSKTLAIVVFLSVLFAAIGLAFVFENLMPRPEPVTDEERGDGGAPREKLQFDAARHVA